MNERQGSERRAATWERWVAVGVKAWHLIAIISLLTAAVMLVIENRSAAFDHVREIISLNNQMTSLNLQIAGQRREMIGQMLNTVYPGQILRQQAK